MFTCPLTNRPLTILSIKPLEETSDNLQSITSCSRVKMKLLIFLVCLLCVNGEVRFCLRLAKSGQDFDSLLQEAGKEVQTLLESTRLGSQDANGTFDNVFINISHPAINFQGIFSGLSEVDKQSIRLFTVTTKGFELFNLTFPRIFFNGTYDGTGYVGAHRLFDIYGNGTFYLTMRNFSIAVLTGLELNSTALCIPMTINVYLKSTESHFDNFMNGEVELEPLLNGALNAIIADAVRIIYREDADAVDPMIQDLIDRFLNGETSKLAGLLYQLSSNKDLLGLLK